MPYSLKDGLVTSDFSSKSRINESIKSNNRFRDFLANRVLTLERDHAKAILDHAGQGTIDYVLVNSKPIPQEFLDKTGAQSVKVDEDKINALGMGLIKADLMSETDAGRHDPEKLCRAVMKIIDDMTKHE